VVETDRGQFGVLRFIAPERGWYALTGTLYCLFDTHYAADATLIRKDDRTHALWSVRIGADVLPFVGRTLYLQEGETVDLILGRADTFTRTRVTAEVFRINAPAPAPRAPIEP
jgi:hypothetical protein